MKYIYISLFIIILSGCGGSTEEKKDILKDTTAPIITLVGESNTTIVKPQKYNELGAIAIDETDGNITVTIVGTVDNNSIGIHTILYSATDAAGNKASIIRGVTVVEDTIAPTLKLIGNSVISINESEVYAELGVIALDDIDSNVTVTIDNSQIDSQNAGNYTVYYIAKDRAGNTTTTTRTVIVKVVCADTYSAEMMQGRDLFNNTCKVCHASDAKSGMFDIRGSIVAEIDKAMEEVPNMVELKLAEQVSAEQRVLISLYLVQIKIDPAVEFGNQCDNETHLTKESLGSRLFFDANLSLRKTLSCSSCHNPGHGLADARFLIAGDANQVQGALSVGDDNSTLGGRNAPTASYAQFIPTFGQNTYGEYFGGQFHDGRAATLKDQAKGPFLDQAEMMMPNGEAVVERVLQNSQYVTDFKTLYGDDIFNDKLKAYDVLAESIASFEKTESFAPFDSKYDRSKLLVTDENYYQMTTIEKKGYDLFFDANRTKCVLCHSINSFSESSHEIFSNFKYDNIGTPKNLAALMARDGNTEKTDLALGGRADINNSKHYGKVRIPTLRNIAVTGPYMSNGVFKELRTILEFYNHMSGNNTTTLNPETNKMWENPEVNATINRKLLKMELLSEEEIQALEAFLRTLTDKKYENL